MKKNDLMEAKNWEIETLKSKAKKLKEEIAELILDKNMNKLKDLRVIAKKRVDLAQILTILRQKQLFRKLQVLSGALPEAEKDDSLDDAADLKDKDVKPGKKGKEK